LRELQELKRFPADGDKYRIDGADSDDRSQQVLSLGEQRGIALLAEGGGFGTPFWHVARDTITNFIKR
jgi:hypothetical protein